MATSQPPEKLELDGEKGEIELETVLVSDEGQEYQSEEKQVQADLEDQEVKNSDDEEELKPSDVEDVAKTIDEGEEAEKEEYSESSDPNRSFRKVLRIVLALCQTVILAVGVSYICWWPSNINIFSNERDGTEPLADTDEEKRILQKWQASYLGLSLLFSYYGCYAEDRGWLTLSMFMNVGIMSLFPFRNVGKEMPFTLSITVVAIISVYLCYMLSERVQDTHLQEYHVVVAHTKKQCLFFDLPDMTVYHMGVLQSLTAIMMVFLGLSWMVLQDQMVTTPVRANFSCNGWPDEQCGRYYGLEAQAYYVARLSVSLVAAGGIGLFGGFFRHRTLLILAMALTIVPFIGILENGIYTMGTAVDVDFMCTDDWWDGRVEMFWGDQFQCDEQQLYHSTSVVLMILGSSFALIHLWVCHRFSEKLQSWEDADDYDVDVNLGDKFRCIFWINNPMKLYKYSLLLCALVVMPGGIMQLYYGVESLGSDQTGENYDSEDVVLLDSPSYIDTPIIFGVVAILSAFSTVAFVWKGSRTMLSFVYCLNIVAIAICWQNCLWHQIDLEYGIVQFATESINIYPVYINDEARDMILESIVSYWWTLGASIIMLFFCVMTHEAMQDEEKMVNNDTDKWIIKVGPNSIKF